MDEGWQGAERTYEQIFWKRSCVVVVRGAWAKRHIAIVEEWVGGDGARRLRWRLEEGTIAW